MAELNAAQREAVDYGDGPLLILAGAGSGKTRVITHRIASLVGRGVEPEAVVAVSFTNKAAGELAERMVPLVGKQRASALHTSTFHRLGLRFLKEEAESAGIGGRFVIFDQADSLGLVKEVLREIYRARASRRLDPMSILARISNWKSAMQPASTILDSGCEYSQVAREVYPAYEERLRAMRAVDFDDLVCRPVELLRDRADIRGKWRRRIEHLLVDEFQDTSEVQLELIKLLTNERRNVCVVGDDDQSIYGWRGANVGNILQFESHFPGTHLVKLETNYRSKAPILEVANAVIGASRGRRHDKTLRSARGEGDPVRRSTCETPRQEAQFVAQEIRELRDKNVPPQEIAVLYRSNLQARLIEEELTSAGIPHRVFGGQQFIDRKEIKDTAAYLRFVINPWDEISLRRILNYPARGVGARTVQRIEAYAAERKIPFTRACFDASRIDGIPDGAKAGLRRLQALVGEAREKLEASGSLHAAASELVLELNLRSALDDSAEGGHNGEQRYRNVQALLGWIERYERKAAQDRKSLQDFLMRVTLNGDRRDGEPEEPAVTLSSLHAAKGLEFSVVFLIGCVEGQLPHTRTTDPKANDSGDVDLEEERRLFYVGITRARDRLYLVASRRRMMRGKVVDVTPSRYLDDLPEAHVEVYEPPAQQELSQQEVASLLRGLLRKGAGDSAAV